ncbi:dTDP-4-dehydrorhamnose reductase [Anaerorhabdus furcosa]|uniref:dTDP-4-dehydrorhamnose reductase n=1 Tax=Anaerorhabdus furcosa TaxID=118967 RepID=A0A1T4NCU4_9FIRM|nr:dTDP-4-dehydrorhamnose reductase [Anaerorhabdus furcosa]SJZ77111.1 dTDP-4-dehydrorhamnose reductase [Anaerorhabdus furcosa]
MSKKIFVTGACGQIGVDVVNELLNRKYEVIATDLCELCDYDLLTKFNDEIMYFQLDIKNEDILRDVINKVTPDIIIHCAAWTSVDLAEFEENQELVRKINVESTKVLASCAKDLDIKIVYISTDYVFDGEGVDPWKPDCNNYNPLNFYGLTKLYGEMKITNALEKYFIVRTSWVFGKNGKNFIKTILELSKVHNEIKVINDQIGSPTYSFDLSRLIVDMIETDKYGYYHITNEGEYISWYELAKEVFFQKEISTKIIPVSTEQYGVNKAIRPLNSRLNKEKIIENGFKPLPVWKDAVSRFLKELEV